MTHARQKRTKGPATKPKALGTQRMRHEASKRTATWIDGDLWKVTGGEKEHLVTAGQYINPKTFICDCGGAHDSPRHVCCHILAVMREM
jgi:hypothetical protein